MTHKISATRRSVLAGAIALTTAPVMAAIPCLAAGSIQESAIAALWRQAEAVRLQLAVYESQIKAAHIRTGLPGWMHVAGRANSLGNRRYDLLVAMLKCEPTTKDDLALLAKVTTDDDMVHGPRQWAHGRFDLAAMQVHSRAA